MALLSESKKFLLNLLVHRCRGCGSRIEPGAGSFCRWCLVRMYPHGEQMAGDTRVFTAFLHSGVVREMVLRLKFGGERKLAVTLAELALSSWKEIPSSEDTVVPVPASPGRHRERGYNQAALIASAVSRATGALFMQPLVRSGGESQIGVPGRARQGNVRGKFSVRSGTRCSGKVWLIDDVMTTGATITEIVSTLSDAGIRRVQPAVVCFRRIGEKSIIPRKEVYHAGV
jgi:ComF family protein